MRGRAFARPFCVGARFRTYAETVSEQVPNEVPGARKRGRPKGSTTGTTKAAILKAASKEFSHAGYEAASLRSVARRAGWILRWCTTTSRTRTTCSSRPCISPSIQGKSSPRPPRRRWSRWARRWFAPCSPPGASPPSALRQRP
ncbi:TetR family transcriptional regulator [Glutamicibacter sp. HZAU]|nr:TetR family transcriptional regulator [Glutamicibacter sp. HZAU]